MEIIIIAFLAIGSLFVFTAFLFSKMPSPAKKKKVAIEVISHIWQKKKEASIALEELASLWKNSQKLPETDQGKEEIIFQHEEITEFRSIYLSGNGFYAGKTKGAIDEILLLLDAEGDCPSVVNSASEPENSLEKNAYEMLAGIKLYQHSIGVAKEIVRLVNSPTIAPKAIITALGHDLGKIPRFRQSYYSMGDHPLISIVILEAILKEISYKDEILKAIKEHHRNPKGLLAEKLKAADQNTRRKEIASLSVVHQGNKQDAEEKAPEPAVKPMPPEPVQKIEPSQKADIFGAGDGGTKEKEKIKLKEIPLEWFDSDEFLMELKPYINKLNGGRWDAFSMPNGYVYFQVKTLWEVIKKIAKKKGHSDILAGDLDEEFRRNCLFGVVNTLKVEKDAIARGLIQDGYFGAPFIVTMSDGTKFKKSFYTPFNVEAFGCMVSDLEMLKKGNIKKITEVVPKFSNEDEDS